MFHAIMLLGMIIGVSGGVPLYFSYRYTSIIIRSDLAWGFVGAGMMAVYLWISYWLIEYLEG
jgi:hypothetical protein